MRRSHCPFTSVLAVLAISAVSALAAPTPTLFASGLLNPNKIIAGPAGTFLVTETGQDPNSGRVSRLNSSGLRTTLIDGLPSGLSAPANEADGVNGLALQGNTLYIAIGEGDTLVNGTVQGTTVANPKGPSSPTLDCVLKVVFSGSVDKLSAGFKLLPADHSTLIEGNPVVLTNTSSEQATVTMLSAFRTVPDARLIYRNSHPFGLAQLASDPASLYMVDAGLNSLVKIDAQTGRARTITKFSNVPNFGTTGPPTVEAVPDSISVWGDFLLVTLLTGFPFAPGDSNVMYIDPATGNSGLFISQLSSAIDIKSRTSSAGHLQFFVLEFSSNQLAGTPGRLKRLDGSPIPEVIVDGLKTPTNMVLDPSGLMYITQRGDGSVVTVDVGQ